MLLFWVALAFLAGDVVGAAVLAPAFAAVALGLSLFALSAVWLAVRLQRRPDGRARRRDASPAAAARAGVTPADAGALPPSAPVRDDLVRRVR